ncbi:hypothetical protein [Phytopseudomonas dryadis]|nr:hypothetical protein [Pseudomonas sp. FRB 230]
MLKSMQNELIIFPWINKIPKEDRQWAREYLRSKKCYIDNTAFEPYGTQPSLANDANNREIESQLRNAWRQRKSRSKHSERKSYTFILSHDKKRALDKIANETFSTITDALEKLIGHEQQRIKEHKEAIAETKKKLKHQKEAHLREIKKLEKDNMEIEQILRATQTQFELQIMKLIQIRLQLDNPYAAHVPTDAIKEKAISLFENERNEVLKRMGTLSLGLRRPASNTERLWDRAVSEIASTDTDS